MYTGLVYLILGGLLLLALFKLSPPSSNDGGGDGGGNGRVYNATGSFGDMFTISITSVSSTSGNVSITNSTNGLEDQDVPWTLKSSGYITLGATNTGINEAFEVPNVGFFARCYKMGQTQDKSGIVSGLRQVPFANANLLNETFAFVSFTPLSHVALNSEGIQTGLLPFRQHTIPASWTDGGNKDPNDGYGTCIPRETYNLSGPWEITRKDLSPYDPYNAPKPTSMIRLVARSYINGQGDGNSTSEFIPYRGDAMFLASPNDFGNTPTGILHNLDANPQNGAIAFATPKGFAADYMSSYGNCFGFNTRSLVDAVNGNYIAFGLLNTFSGNVVYSLNIRIQKTEGGLTMTIGGDNPVLFIKVNSDDATPEHTYRSYTPGITSFRNEITSYNQINFTEDGLALLSWFQRDHSLEESSCGYFVMKRVSGL